MKIPKLVVPLLFFSSFLFAQDYMQTITSTACECIKKISKNQDKQKINMELGLCLLDAASPFQKELQEEYDVGFSNMNSNEGEKLGRIIGAKLAVDCPEFLRIVSDQYVDEDDNNQNNGSYTGVVKAISDDIFIEISLASSDGKTLQFYWLTYVDTEFDLTTDYHSLLNQKVDIEYNPQEFFDARLKEYRTFNVITGITVLKE